MLFKIAELERIQAGAVTLAFRQWRRPTVKAGGTLRTALGVLAIEAVDALEAFEVTPDDALRAGFESREALLQGLGDSPPDGRLYRIALCWGGDDPRKALAREAVLSDDDVAGLRASLDGLDRNARWTLAVLHQIAANEGLVAERIATAVGMDRVTLKRRVRRLKELGLTQSLDVGYRLSPRGKALLKAL